jgi:hypothetical protein
MAKTTTRQSAGPSAWAVGLLIMASAFALAAIVLCVTNYGPG